jgi:SLOG cluster3 family
MKFPWEPNRDAAGLPSPRLFLSASVPAINRDQRFLRGPAEPRLMVRVIETRVRDAVASLVVQLLRAGGQLIFGGQPAITPMVAAAAQNFSRDKGEQFPILLYQSEYFRSATPPIGREEMEARGMAKVVWVPANPEEAAQKISMNTPYLEDPAEFNDLCLQVQHDSKSAPELTRALAVLRVVMLLQPRPQAILSMGGMEGIGAESAFFQRLYEPEIRVGNASFVRDDRSRPAACALKSTYGAGSQLDHARTTFIDEVFFARRENESSTREAMLRPEQKAETVETQMMQRIRYDGMMREFIQGLSRPA